MQNLFALTAREVGFVRSGNPIALLVCQSHSSGERGCRTVTGLPVPTVAVEHSPFLDTWLSRVNC